MHNPPTKPFANSYWVIPGRLLAGEYPLSSHNQDSAARLQNLLLAGVSTFINLTDQAEQPDYAGHLPEHFAGKPVQVERWPMKDHAVPETLESMNLILDRIDAAMQNDAVVYVHCRAGIGRTGMVIGCYLVRQGHSGRDALDELNRLWRDSGTAGQWSAVPKTEAQAHFVDKYATACHAPTLSVAVPIQACARVDAAQQNRYRGALLGMAVAEALVGATSQDTALPTTLAGQAWQSNTGMTWALGDSLLHAQGMDANDQMQRYLRFSKQQQYGLANQAIVVPECVSKSLWMWQLKRIAMAGSHDPRLLDAHSLSRTTAVALYYRQDPARCVHEAAQATRTTLQSPLVIDSCRVIAALLVEIVSGATLAQLVSLQEGPAFNALRALALKPEIQQLIDGQWRQALNEPARNDCLSVLASALHALFTGNDFVSSLQRALAQPGTPLHVAALTGALAGALYGVHGLPLVWRETVARGDELCALADRLLIEARPAS